MLAYIPIDAPGAADALLTAVAERLMAEGWPLAGAVQANPEGARGDKCHMDLHILASDNVVRISQDLGALARGCRLDPAGLAAAVGLAEAALDRGPRLVIVNKFGKQEVDGQGFRPLIGRALSDGIPVLTAVGPANLPGFLAFAGEMAEEVPADADAILTWARGAAPERAAAE
jgi:hypothetical protein